VYRRAAEDHQRGLAEGEPGLACLGALIDHGEELYALGSDHAGELRHGISHRKRAELGDDARLILGHGSSPQSGRCGTTHDDDGPRPGGPSSVINSAAPPGGRLVEERPDDAEIPVASS
jgi:hypothetical protein